MEQPPDNEIKNPALLAEALELFIEKTRRERAESRSWIRQPNNFISAVAIVLSLLSIGWQIRKDYTDGINNDLASLSKVISDLTQIDTQLLTSATVNDNLQIAFNNRRVVLLAEAGRLIGQLGPKAPESQLAALGPEYVAIDDFDNSLKYLGLMTKPSASRPEQLAGWRSIGNLYRNQGSEGLNKARQAYQKAAEIWADPKDFGAVNLEISVHEQWAQAELGYQNYKEAFQQFNQARLLANRIPCIPGRIPVVTRIGTEAQGVVVPLARIDPAQGAAAQAAWNNTLNADRCPKPESPTPEPAASVTSAGLTTLCRFNNGPRAGTTFDFKPYGYAAVPVGTPCNDGVASTGIAIPEP